MTITESYCSITAMSKQPTRAPRWAKLADAAAYMGHVSVRTMRRRIADGQLTRHRVGRIVLIDLNEIDALLLKEK